MLTWWYYWRGVLNMSLDEWLLLTPGELGSLIACYQIANGLAKEKKKEIEGKYIPDLR